MSERPRRTQIAPERFRFSLYTKAPSRTAVVRTGCKVAAGSKTPIDECLAKQPVATPRSAPISVEKDWNADLDRLKALLKRVGGFPVENDIGEAASDDSYENE